MGVVNIPDLGDLSIPVPVITDGEFLEDLQRRGRNVQLRKEPSNSAFHPAKQGVPTR